MFLDQFSVSPETWLTSLRHPPRMLSLFIAASSGTCLAQVAVDFSDLESVVLGALADLPKSQTIADTAYLRLVEHTKEANVARDVAALLRKVAPA